MKIEKKYKPELICSKDTTRYVLNECHLDDLDGKKVLVATDGRVLVQLPITEADGEEGTVPAKALKFARQNAHRRDTFMSFVLGEKVEFTNGWVMPRGEQLNFPDWRKVVPDFPVKMTIGLDAGALWRLAQSMGTEQVKIDISSPTSGLIVRPLNPDGAMGVLMPCRTI